MSAIIEHNAMFARVACNSCKHFDRLNFEKTTCDAFDNIPHEILNGDNPHLKSLPNQKNDIVYEPENQ